MEHFGSPAFGCYCDASRGLVHHLGHAYPDTDTDTDTDTNTNAYPHAYPHANADANTNAYPHADTYPGAKQLRVLGHNHLTVEGVDHASSKLYEPGLTADHAQNSARYPDLGYALAVLRF
mgnify:CR=1 FL=1